MAIRVMSENLANKIAAGEVVEKVVSIVKELVENSVDAKSTDIKVELTESGLREIKITDNGIGMNKEDAVLAFSRHATSKIYDDDDLFNINSLGFRGEALPSIAAVSEVYLTTCYKDDEVGTLVHIKGGKVLDVSESDGRHGTCFKISNLFYNTPARLKHLSSPYAELSNVIEYMNKMSLSYPNIKFRLINDSKELLNTSGDGNLLKIIRNIYGIDVAKRMIKIDNFNDDYKISGYISLPEVTRSSKNHMSTIVNGRVVKNSFLFKTINDGYSNFKEDTRYPIAVILIETDPSLLDVNIHPSKMDIKFSNFEDLNNLIKSTIIDSIKDKLLIPNITPVHGEVEHKENIQLNISRNDSTSTNNYVDLLSAAINNRVEEDNELIIDDNEILTDNNESMVETVSNENKLPELYPVGLLLGTYIVCENEKGIYLIDQHAAKERINYEHISYVLSHPGVDTISPMIPIVVEIPMNELLIIEENKSILDSLHIEYMIFGNSSIRVTSHPTWFPEGKEAETISRIIELIVNKEKNFSLEKFNDNLAKMVSCKMSIKANTFIDKASMESLINDLRKCNNPYNCPHGRPSIIHFSIYELEKMFKRSI